MMILVEYLLQSVRFSITIGRPERGASSIEKYPDRKFGKCNRILTVHKTQFMARFTRTFAAIQANNDNVPIMDFCILHL